MSDIDKNVYEKALERWGLTLQMDMLVEECAELIHAIQKIKRSGLITTEGEDKVCEEMADVSIVIEQMLYAFNRDIFNKKYREKIERLEKRIQP